MKKITILVILMGLSLIGYSQNYIQGGMILNYGFTTLKSSQIGVGGEFTLRNSLIDNISMTEGVMADLNGGKTNRLDKYSYGDLYFQICWGFNYDIFKSDFSNSSVYLIFGICGNLSYNIYTNTNLSDKEALIKNHSIYPSGIIGIGKSIEWGYNGALIFELKYHHLISDQYDNIKIMGSNHCDSFISIGVKFETRL